MHTLFTVCILTYMYMYICTHIFNIHPIPKLLCLSAIVKHCTISCVFNRKCAHAISQKMQTDFLLTYEHIFCPSSNLYKYQNQHTVVHVHHIQCTVIVQSCTCIIHVHVHVSEVCMLFGGCDHPYLI